MLKLHLNPLENKIVFEATFVAESPIHIGAGEEESRRELIRLPTGEVVIPATSWKGVLRKMSEQAARSMALEGLEDMAVKLYTETKAGIRYRRTEAEEELRKVAAELAEKLRGGKTRLLNGLTDIYSTLRELGYSEEEIEEMRNAVGLNERLLDSAEKILAITCPLGRLYGNNILAAKVRPLDTFIRPAIQSVAGIAINRASNTLVKRMLYIIQAIKKGTEIPLRIIMDNLIPGKADSRIMAATLEMIDSMGLSIGARKSSGMGRLRLVKADARILDLRRDGEREELAIGNIRKRIEPINLTQLIRWLRKEPTW